MPHNNHAPAASTAIHRRTFLGRTSLGLGALSLSAMGLNSLAAPTQLQAATSGLLGATHHTPKAKRVIFLCMAGGPSHIETFDPKPKLAELHGQPMPESFTAGQPIAQLQGQALKCQA